jgi:hypothetical protein
MQAIYVLSAILKVRFAHTLMKGASVADNAIETGNMDLKHWSDLVARINLTPDENPADFEPLHTALMQDLEPGTPYETMLAENLVALEWEMLRHRRLRDGLLLTAFREQLMVAISDEPQAMQNPDKRKVLDSQIIPLLDQLTDNKLSGRSQLNELLKPLNSSVTELVASAYSKASEFIANHENRLAQLEGRRRKLMQDFHALKQSRLKRAEMENVTDA